MPSDPASFKALAELRTVSVFLDQIKTVRRLWKMNSSAENALQRKQLWFRGQPDAGDGLRPKLYRRAYRYAIDDEAEIRQQFKIRALQLITGRVPQSEFEWYFLMQHYGVPTRLLDWTDNPLLALYFAVAARIDSSVCDAAVWILDPWWLNSGMKGISGPILPDWEEARRYLFELEDAFSKERAFVGKLKNPAAIDPPHVDRRVAVQGSHFVIYGKTKDLVSLRKSKSRGAHLAKLVLNSESLEAMRRELSEYGISHFSVFPDLQGLGEELRLECLPIPKLRE